MNLKLLAMKLSIALCLGVILTSARVEADSDAGSSAPTITLGKVKSPLKRISDAIEDLNASEKELLKDQADILRWRDDLARYSGRMAQLNKTRTEAGNAPPEATADPSWLPHLDACLFLLGELVDTTALLAETYRQEQQEIALALKRARRLLLELKEPTSPSNTIARAMTLEEILHFLRGMSVSRISLSLLKAQRAGLNEELDQRLRLKKLAFTLPALSELSGDSKLREATMALRTEAEVLHGELKGYRKTLAQHLVGQTRVQLHRIRLEIFEREENLKKLESQREQVFLALRVSRSNVAAAKTRLETATQRIEAEQKKIQREIKALRMKPPEDAGETSFTAGKEWNIQITALQHRLYLLNMELKAEVFRAGAMATLYDLVARRAPASTFFSEHAHDLDSQKQQRAREELANRRDAWRHEYSRLSTEKPQTEAEEKIAGRLLAGYRQILDLYDQMDLRKWDIEWCAELIRFYKARNEAKRRDLSWYAWRGIVSGLFAVAGLFICWFLGRMTLRPLTRRSGVRSGLRYLMFLCWTLGSLAVGAALAALNLEWVWGIPPQLPRAVEVLTSVLFTIGDKEVSLASLGGFFGIIALTLLANRLLVHFVKSWIFSYFTWDLGIQHAILAVLKYMVLFGGIALGLEFIGIGLSALALFAGVIGIGIGFGLQNIASNFIAGLIILFERPIKKGDYVDLGGLEGRVDQISARATTLVTRNNVSVIVPNSEFIANRVVNLSHGSEVVRLMVRVGVAYDSDLAVVSSLLVACASSHPQILQKPMPSVRLENFGDSSLNMLLLAWTANLMDKDQTVSEIHLAIDAAFREHGIAIPFPQRDLHIRSGSPPSGL